MLAVLVHFVGWAGVGGAAQKGRWARLAERAAIFSQHFGSWSLPACFAAVALGAWASFQGPPAYRRPVAFLTGGIVVHLAYWFSFSTGWPRYLLIAALLLAALLALLVFSGEARLSMPAIAVAVLIFGSNASRLHRSGYGVLDGIQALFSRGTASRPAAAQGAVDYLLRHPDRQPFPAEWIATVVDMEYLLPGAVNFELLRDAFQRCEQTGCTVAENRMFREPNPWYEALLQRCGAPVYEAEPYRIYSCPPR